MKGGWIAKENLREIKRHVRKLEEKVTLLEEHIGLLKKRIKDNEGFTANSFQFGIRTPP